MISCEAFDNNESNINVSYYLYPRSSTGSKTPLRMSNSTGIIDSNYRGNIIGIVDNISEDDYIIEAGSRLFQICSRNLDKITISTVNILSSTVRGSDGLGSTGV